MASVQDLTHQSGFVFDALLEQLGASTSSGYPATPETAIVRITKITKSTPALAGYEGQQITVRLQAPVTLQVAQNVTFFTQGIHYGDGMVVDEIGHVLSDATALARDLTGAMQASDDTEMTQRMAQAEVIITGVAGAPKPFTPPPSAAREIVTPWISEHDPDWWSATVTVETVEKGVHTASTAEVVYANSMDVAWHQAPKVKQGDHGTWLLHANDLYGKAVPAPAATHPLDFHPIAAVSRVQSLMK